MPHSAKPAGFRAAALTAALLSFVGIAIFLTPSPAPAARISIVNGEVTNIASVPWQVAITVGQPRGRDFSPRKRFFCGGSLITPELVITAGHCVVDLKQGEVKKIEIVSGRTRLNNESQGTVTRVRNVLMPRRPDGTRRYYNQNGGASWDVALLRLASPIEGTTIKLAGSNEALMWAPGQLVSTTGWGVTASPNRKVSAVLRTTRQVMLPDGVCKRFNGLGYSPRVMNCVGGPAQHTTTCYGDSGGPLVARSGTEVRLVGLTSFGDIACTPNLPSVDSRIASGPMRTWVRDQGMRISGIDVVGSDSLAAPLRTWCRVPDMDGLTVRSAKAKLTARGCRLGKVIRQRHTVRAGRVFAASVYPGWLAPVGTSVKLWIGQ